MAVSLPTQRDRLGLGTMQVDKVTGHIISHQLSDKSRPAILFQREQPGLLCRRPGSAESRFQLSFCWAHHTLLASSSWLKFKMKH